MKCKADKRNGMLNRVQHDRGIEIRTKKCENLVESRIYYFISLSKSLSKLLRLVVR